jgi:hypothetical protein
MAFINFLGASKICDLCSKCSDPYQKGRLIEKVFDALRDAFYTFSDMDASDNREDRSSEEQDCGDVIAEMEYFDFSYDVFAENLMRTCSFKCDGQQALVKEAVHKKLNEDEQVDSPAPERVIKKKPGTIKKEEESVAQTIVQDEKGGIIQNGKDICMN